MKRKDPSWMPPDSIRAEEPNLQDTGGYRGETLETAMESSIDLPMGWGDGINSRALAYS